MKKKKKHNPSPTPPPVPPLARKLEYAMWGAIAGFAGCLTAAGAFDSQSFFPGLASMCLGTVAILIAAEGVVSGQLELRQGTYRRASEPIGFWLTTFGFASLGTVFLVAGVLIAVGIIDV